MLSELDRIELLWRAAAITTAIVCIPSKQQGSDVFTVACLHLAGPTHGPLQHPLHHTKKGMLLSVSEAMFDEQSEPLTLLQWLQLS